MELRVNFDKILIFIGKMNDKEKIEILDVNKSENETKPYDNFEKSFGAFISDQSAEEMAAEIRNSRLFNRKIEEF
jgi:hypothetical protein